MSLVLPASHTTLINQHLADLPVHPPGRDLFRDSSLVSESYQLHPLSSSFLSSDSDLDSVSDSGYLLPFHPVVRPRHRHRQPLIMSTATKIGHGLAKGLGIKLNYRNELDEEIRRGESVFSIQTADTYVEQEPRSIEWLQSITPSGRDILRYLKSLFPFLYWIDRYNLQWLAGDLIAGRYHHSI